MSPITASRDDVARDMYQAAERRLWEAAGATPSERRVRLSGDGIAVRVLEVGEGPPTIFLHGGPGAAGSVWACLATGLPHLRCILVDRPGTGLSDPLSDRLDHTTLRPNSERFLADLLDGLELDRAHVVGSSHGSYIALTAALRHPDRVARMVHMGCPGFVEGMALTAMDRVVLWPGMARLFSMAPTSKRDMEKVFRQLGHGESMDAGRIPPEFMDWAMAVVRHTGTMREELTLMARLGSFRGFHPSLTVRDDELAALRSPTLFYWGEHDPYGDAEVALRLASVIPGARLEQLRGAGHLPWLDDPAAAARAVGEHLAAASPGSGQATRLGPKTGNGSTP